MTALATRPTAEGLRLDDTIVTEDYTIGALVVLRGRDSTPIMWDSRNQAEVDVARAAFTSAIETGGLAFAAQGKDTYQGTQLVRGEFDPAVERIVVISPIAGG